MPDFAAADVVSAEQGIRSRTIEILRSLDDAQVSAPVATCPGWTVRELACHDFGVIDDILDGRLEGAGSDAWTAAQVERHGAKSMGQICDEWESVASAFDDLLLAVPEPVNLQIVMDQATHEHDLRLAVGRPGAQDDPSLGVAAAYLFGILSQLDPELSSSIEGLDLPAFDVVRSITGRRSLEQLDALGIESARLAEVLRSTPFTVTTAAILESA